MQQAKKKTVEPRKSKIKQGKKCAGKEDVQESVLRHGRRVVELIGLSRRKILLIWRRSPTARKWRGRQDPGSLRHLPSSDQSAYWLGDG
ncbi:hypothetical protein CEXT_254681 [Caerostris extrusa]|uniref:Uncharacterized protein n=1 Tax=Caerostris extrusa TaxID=172846 RepID=A0AAV4PZA0_CAEEX|nr:hypothetical protein CEXT_254681 [Caerostris extrusa]